MKIINSNRFHLPNTDKKYLHLATVTDRMREYICFLEMSTNKMFIEEITTGQLEYVFDESIVEEIATLLHEAHLTDLRYGLLVPDKDE